MKSFEDSDLIQIETEVELAATSKDGASIKLAKSFNFEDVRSYNLLKINLQIKLKRK